MANDGNLKTIGLIQARMNSTRLPGKVLLPILGKPVLWHMYHRLKQSKLIDEVVISTGPENKNKKICDYLSSEDIPFFSGSEVDLIDRIYKTALCFDASTIVRITADCPFVDPNVVDKILTEYFKTKNQYDIVSNSNTHSFPHGLEIEVYPIETIKKLHTVIKELKFREWFPTYIEKHPNEFNILNITNNQNLSKFRLTIDYPEDYDLSQLIYQELYPDNHIFLMEDIVELLSRRPDLVKINSKYLEHVNIDAPI